MKLWVLRIVAGVGLALLVGVFAASAHQSQGSPTSVCLAGETCLWNTQDDYNTWWMWGQEYAFEAAYEGNDSNFDGNYYPGSPGTAEWELINTPTVARNIGTSCYVTLHDYIGWDEDGWKYLIWRGVTVNPLPSWANNDASSLHWCYWNAESH